VDNAPHTPIRDRDRTPAEAARNSGPGASVRPPPAGELELALIGIWSRVLGLETVGLEDDFFELGGDSMKAAHMFIELEDRWGIDRPLSLLAEAPTISSLALALTRDSDWESLLPVQTGSGKAPLFVVHDGTGSVLYARGLAVELGSDQPIYGIRCEELNGEPLRASSFKDLAASYVERIRGPYPHGPYLFYGASIGGVIAMEMARQLMEAGEEVPIVALGDSRAPAEDTSSKAFGERLAAWLRDLRGLPLAARARPLLLDVPRRLFLRAHRAASSESRAGRKHERIFNRALQRGETVPLPARPIYIMRVYEGLLSGHRLRPPYPQRVLLLRADESDIGWRAIVGDALAVVDVPGSHGDLGREASGPYVGPILDEALNDLPGTLRNATSPPGEVAEG
jgi:thioesterase domain-containing protein/acyl carrier protein